jgi:diguanylate cyclase (GGDEF)-like protein
VPLLANVSLRQGILLFAAVLSFLIAGTYATIKLTTDYLLNLDAEDNARDWASNLAANVGDLAQIAGGERPSTQSMIYFRSAHAVGHVFRYIIYNREGYSQLISDAHGVSLVDVSVRSGEAVAAIGTRQPVIASKTSDAANGTQFVAEAFVPVFAGAQPVGVVAAYVDESEQRARFYKGIIWSSLLLCGLTALSFGVPAIAWYRRTREKQRADRRIQFLAHHDPLTGLANRSRLIERLDAALAVLPATRTMLAVHYLDVDHFKHINDTLGHDGGDFLLNTVGERLRAIIRIEDMVARLGGDEFVIVQTGLAALQQAQDFAERMAAALNAPITYRGQEMRVSFTIGVAVAPADATTSERLLKCADLALYNGKADGRNCIRFFAPEMDAAMQKRVALEQTIRDAIEHQGFEVYYQPLFEVKGKKLIGFEALARLRGPDGAYIPPATFIPLAEELRLIDRLGEWVLRSACRTAQLWPEPLTVAVNLSPSQFQIGDIETIVREALEESGLQPHRLELEITETVLLMNDEATMAKLKNFKNMGVCIVMDDFGTGYSSLSYLWKFPFDKIKIDRSFMESFEQSGRHVESVVKSIIALGRELNMRVTVEGVETTSQVDFLYNADADQVQGFFFGRPVPASEVGADILKDYRNSVTSPEPDARGLRVVKTAAEH